MSRYEDKLRSLAAQIYQDKATLITEICWPLFDKAEIPLPPDTTAKLSVLESGLKQGLNKLDKLTEVQLDSIVVDLGILEIAPSFKHTYLALIKKNLATIKKHWMRLKDI